MIDDDTFKQLLRINDALFQKHVQSFAGIPIQVAELTEDQTAERYVRFSYVGIING
jgi:hypothetical protein